MLTEYFILIGLHVKQTIDYLLISWMLCGAAAICLIVPGLILQSYGINILLSVSISMWVLWFLLTIIVVIYCILEHFLDQYIKARSEYYANLGVLEIVSIIDKIYS